MYSPCNALSSFFLKQELPVTGHAVTHQNQGDFVFFLAVTLLSEVVVPKWSPRLLAEPPPAGCPRAALSAAASCPVTGSSLGNDVFLPEFLGASQLTSVTNCAGRTLLG